MEDLPRLEPLHVALLAVCAPERTPLHRVHGELEHWLNRQLATDEVESAIAELEARGLIVVQRDRAVAAFLATAAGRAVVAARWEEFFPP
jgi:hypothetical protein